MNDKPLERLEHLKKKNIKNSKWINQNLYRFFFLEKIYIVAYKKTKYKKFEVKSLTSKIQYLVHLMRQNKFDFIIRKFFDTLAKDQQDLHDEVSFYIDLVKEIVKMLLIVVYQPSFLSNTQKLFLRPSFFADEKEVHYQLSTVKWIIQSNYLSTWNTISSSFVISLLRERIKDERFLSLILSILKFESFQKDDKKLQLNKILNSSSLTLSSILKSVYFRELDLFIQKNHHLLDQVNILTTKQTLETCKFIMRNHCKKKESKNNLFLNLKERNFLDLRRLTTQKFLHSIPNNLPSAVKKIYVRYIDEWIVGINDSYSTALNLKYELLRFLQNKLKFKINDDEIQVISLYTQQLTFLNYQIKVNLNNNSNRLVSYFITLNTPIRKVVAMLAERGFCDRSGKPKSKKSWIVHEDNKIIRNYNVLLKKIITYYIKTDNFNKLFHIQRILKISCLHTLAHRHKSSLRKIFEKYAFKLKM